MTSKIARADMKDLDRPVWGSLTQGLSTVAQGTQSALRIHPDYGQFAACADLTEKSLKELVRLADAGEIWLLEREQLPPVHGLTFASHGEYLQMILPGGAPYHSLGFCSHQVIGLTIFSRQAETHLLAWNDR